jgi:hypothetical protein
MSSYLSISRFLTALGLATFLSTGSPLLGSEQSPGTFYFLYLAPAYTPEEILAMEEGEVVDPVMVFSSEGQSHRQSFARNLPIGPFFYAPQEKISLASRSADGAEKIEPLPLDPKESFQLLLAQKDTTGRISFSSRTFDFSSFPEGSFNVLNLTDVPVAGVIHGDRFQTPAGQIFSKTLDLPERARFDLHLVAQDKGQAISLREGLARFQPGHRYFALILPSCATDQSLPKVEMIVENTAHLSKSLRDIKRGSAPSLP